MKVLICGVPYSDNLGDGVISDNIRGVIERNSDIEVSICDISYRQKIEIVENKSLFISYLSKAPLYIRQLVVLAFFTAKYLKVGRSYLNKKTENIDLIIIGGGQLLCDVDLNFPIKLYLLLKIAERKSIPIKICSVGVSNKWSMLGKLIIKRLLTSSSVERITVRDTLSQMNLKDIFGSDSTILPDPALLTAKFLPRRKYQDLNSKVVAIGLADIACLNYSADVDNSLIKNAPEIIVETAKYLAERSNKVLIFTNGAIEDERYVQKKIAPLLENNTHCVEIVNKFDAPYDLISFISSVDVVIAFRLHANIISFSYGIPSYAISWDNKVSSFFSKYNRSNCVFDDFASLYEYVKRNDIFNDKIIEPLSISSIEKDYLNFLDVTE